MTQSSQNGSRLDRIEAIVLELATASVRHDNEFSRINATLNQITEQQKQFAAQYQEQFGQLTEQQRQLTEQQRLADTRYEQQFTRLDAAINTNTEQIAHLTASLVNLRNLVADYLQGRSQT